jgi:aryl-alcohol dehydrogenase-like predicted oxidoreductase
MTIGKTGAEQARVHDLPTAAALLDNFQSHGHSEIDTASSYGEGSSETMLAQLDWQSRNLAMATKYYPTAGRAVPSSWDSTLRHTPAALRENLEASLKALKTDNVDMWYLHAPDRTTPFAETFEAVDSLYRESLIQLPGLGSSSDLRALPEPWLEATGRVSRRLQRSAQSGRARIVSVLTLLRHILLCLQPTRGRILDGSLPSRHDGS